MLFTGNDLVIGLAVPIVIVALGLVSSCAPTPVSRSEPIADNRERAMLLGVPVRRLATIVWTVAGLLATIAVILPGARRKA